MSGDTYHAYVRLTATDGPRVLARISTLIAGRGHRILAARYDQDGTHARMLLIVTGPERLRHNLLARIAQCVDVIDLETFMTEERDGVCEPTSDDRVQIGKLRTYLNSDGHGSYADATLELVVDGARILVASDGESTLDAVTTAFHEAMTRALPEASRAALGDTVVAVLDDHRPLSAQVLLQTERPPDRCGGRGVGKDVAVATTQALAALYSQLLASSGSEGRPAKAAEVAL